MPSINTLKTDGDLEEQGASLALMDGVTVCVRSAQSKKARAWTLKRFKKSRSVFASGGTMSLDQMDQLDIDKVAEVLITGWTGITEDDDATPIPFSVEAARTLATEVAEFRGRVLSFANEQENFRAAEVEALAKNSSTPSTRSSGTVGAAA